MNSYRMIVVIIGAVIYFCNAESNDTLGELDIEERDEFLGKNLNKLPTGMPGWARRFTRSKTGCPCWWDLEQKLTDPTTNAPYVCACCKPNALQCGYPEHQRCEKKKSGQRRGCNGVQAKGETLSEIGFPCNFDPTRRDCAWCTYGKKINSFSAKVKNSNFQF